MAVIIQMRRGTKDQWEDANPILANGEFGLETDTRRQKCGNGVDYWNDLEYFSDQNANRFAGATGLINGGVISINVDNTKFNVSAGFGYITDVITNPSYPTRILVEWDEFIEQSTPYLATDDLTFISIDENGDLYLSTEDLTEDHSTDLIILGWIDHRTRTEISTCLTEPYFGANDLVQLHQFLEVMGAFNVDGNIYSSNGSNLKLDRSAGRTFDNGTYYEIDKKNPNIFISNQESEISMQYYYRDGLGDWFNDLAVTDIIDPDHYDDGSGILASVPSGKFTIQRMYQYSPSNENDITYGQVLYDTIDDASLAINESTELNEYLLYNTFRAWIIVQEGTTDLSDSDKCLIISANRYGIISGSVGGTAGEINTASNIGTEGIGVYHQKSGIDLQFRNVVSKDSRLAVALNSTNKTIELTVQDHASSHLPNGSDALTTAAPTTNLSSSTTNSVGTANSLARSNHSHAITTSTPVSTGTTNSIGAGPGLARSNHVHNTVIKYQTYSDHNNVYYPGDGHQYRIDHFDITLSYSGYWFIICTLRFTNDKFKVNNDFWLFQDGNEIRDSMVSMATVDWADGYYSVTLHSIVYVSSTSTINAYCGANDGTISIEHKTLTGTRLGA